MGKLSNMLYMIDLLNTGNIYTLKELANKLGVTERMVRYYKNEICNIPAALDQLYSPEYVGFLIVGYIKEQEQDEIIDGGDIVQRRENKKK